MTYTHITAEMDSEAIADLDFRLRQTPGNEHRRRSKGGAALREMMQQQRGGRS